ncbi:MAG: DUF255 domain-containing protein [Bacteroidetes bacterium]|nr:DUF255 domain-containing protein [Bacteroidota bacterium]
MKQAILLVLSFILFTNTGFAGNKDKQKEGQATAKEIHWMTLDDVQVAMKEQPKKVWIDVYTGWCGWCKRMDQTTFQNPNVIQYMNEHFYAVKLDAEQKTDIRFLGKMYHADPTKRTHPFAEELLKGQMSYPTSVVLQENFQMPQAIPGYQDVKTIEMILKYFGEAAYKTTPWATFSENFKSEW